MVLKPGPYATIPTAPGETASFYTLRYDKFGRSEGPATQRHLVETLAGGDFTDVFLFSHGWNNDWKTALNRYRDFMSTFRAMIDGHELSFDREYRPILAGVFWPSTALVMPWEAAPEFAGSDGEEAADATDLLLIGDLAVEVAAADVERYYELVEEETLDQEAARELLTIVAPVVAHGDPDLEGDPGREVNDLLASWAMLEATLAPQPMLADPDDFGAAGTGRTTSAAVPEAAGFLDRLNPRNLVRALTVWQMKDRAGVVGAKGVGPLLRDMLTATEGKQTRYHLLGHSYGARVVLNAVARPEGRPLPRAVDSMLLLQPAVNHLCFADALPDGRRGGYHAAPHLVKKPILTTFSVHDVPLHDTFHLALRRGKDLGEIEIAADEPPNEYAALGGYGPRGLQSWREVAIKQPKDLYDIDADNASILALNGRGVIKSHGGVVNEATAWALFNLVRG